MRFIPFFKKAESLKTEVVSERLNRTTSRIKESLEAMTFTAESGLQGLIVEEVHSSDTDAKLLKVTGDIPGNEIGLGLQHLKPIEEQLNQELAADARPFQVSIEKVPAPIDSFGESSAIEEVSYLLKIVEIPPPAIEPGENIIRTQFNKDV